MLRISLIDWLEANCLTFTSTQWLYPWSLQYLAYNRYSVNIGWLNERTIGFHLTPSHRPSHKPCPPHSHMSAQVHITPWKQNKAPVPEDWTSSSFTLLWGELGACPRDLTQLCCCRGGKTFQSGVCTGYHSSLRLAGRKYTAKQSAFLSSNLGFATYWPHELGQVI